MSPAKLKKLLESDSPKKIIALYHMEKIDLTDNQLSKIIKIKNEREKVWKK